MSDPSPSLAELQMHVREHETAMARVQARIKELQRGLRGAMPQPAKFYRAPKPVPRPRKERVVTHVLRRCDECHAKKPIVAFDGSSETCQLCEHELSTPAKSRRALPNSSPSSCSSLAASPNASRLTST